MHKYIIAILTLAIFSTISAQQLPTDTSDQWFKVMLNNQKAGYVHHKSETSPDFVKTHEFVKLNIGRGGTIITATVSESTEFKWQPQNLRYKLDSFSSSMEFGPAVVKAEGKLAASGMYNIIQSISGNTNQLEFAISDKVHPVEILMQEAVKEGLTPGTTVTGTVFSPSDMSEIDYKVVVLAKEKLTGYSEPLFKCKTTMTLRDTPVETISYVDAEGNDVISTIDMMGIKFQFIAAEMEEALANEGVAEVLTAVSIKVPAGSPDPTKANAVRCKIKFDKPGVKFYHDQYQQITSQNGSGCTLELTPIQPQCIQKLPDDNFQNDPQEVFDKSMMIFSCYAKEDYEIAKKTFNPKNLWLSYTNPAIKKLAQQAIAAENDSWLAARKIESFVHQYISAKNLDTGWASAPDVAKNKSGDCSEHAVLTAAMCLASGIPARVAVGYYYAGEFANIEKSYFGHAWTQVWICGRWYNIDATRPHQSQSPAYIISAVIDGNPMNAYKITQSFFKVEKIEVIK